jgi:hypothetical protein
VVVLHKVRGQAQNFELVGAVSFHKKTPFILKYFWGNNDNLVEMCGFFPNLHCECSSRPKEGLPFPGPYNDWWQPVLVVTSAATSLNRKLVSLQSATRHTAVANPENRMRH